MLSLSLFAEMSNEALLITAITTLVSVITIGVGALWKMATWMRDNVVKPTVTSHLDLVSQLKETLPKQQATLVSIAKSNKNIETDTAEHLVLQKEEMKQLASIAEVGQKQAESSVKQLEAIQRHQTWAEGAVQAMKEKKANGNGG